MNPIDNNNNKSKKSDPVDNGSNEHSYEIMIRNLKILGNIKPNDKLIKHGDTIKLDSPYIYQGISRYWYGDSRKESLNHIEQLIEDCFHMIDLIYGSEIERRTGGLDDYYNCNKGQKYFETENAQKLTIFSTELLNVIKGLNNLKQTYHSDISTCSRIEVVIEKINLRIQKIQELFQININSIGHDMTNTLRIGELGDNFQFTDEEDSE